jgi:intermediate peptidase
MPTRSARTIRNVLTRSLRPTADPRIANRCPSVPHRHTVSTAVHYRRAESAPIVSPGHQSATYHTSTASHVSGPSSRADEAGIRAHFDQPLPLPSHTASSVSGLFLFPPLTDPTSLSRLTERTLIHGRAIVQRICDAPLDSTGLELRLVVKNLDRLSDLLCGVIDMCELVRNTHPDAKWVEGSNAAYERLCGFMNELNADQGLYKASSACGLS